MSAEFEKVVLEKLEKIEIKLEEHDKKFEEYDTKFDKTNKAIISMEHAININSKVIEGLSETIRVNQNLLTLFEYDFNQKMQTALDGIAAINERNAKYDDMFMQHSAKLFNHDVRISALEEREEYHTK